jgi:hypothetical protein
MSRRGKEKDIPSSTPYANSNDCPVSSQIGNGIYCNSFLSFEICSPVSLFAHQPSSSPFCHTQSQSLSSSPSNTPSPPPPSSPDYTARRELTCSYSNTPPGSSPHNGNSATESCYVLPPLLHPASPAPTPFLYPVSPTNSSLSPSSSPLCVLSQNSAPCSKGW